MILMIPGFIKPHGAGGCQSSGRAWCDSITSCRLTRQSRLRKETGVFVKPFKVDALCRSTAFSIYSHQKRITFNVVMIPLCLLSLSL